MINHRYKKFCWKHGVRCSKVFIIPDRLNCSRNQQFFKRFIWWSESSSILHITLKEMCVCVDELLPIFHLYTVGIIIYTNGERERKWWKPTKPFFERFTPSSFSSPSCSPSFHFDSTEMKGWAHKMDRIHADSMDTIWYDFHRLNLKQ